MRFFLHMNTITFTILLSLGILLASVTNSPEEIIVGKWKEAEWTYEISDLNVEDKKLHPTDIKELVGQELMIHKSEKWEFLPNHKVIFYKKDKSKIVADWRIKGRGHILKILYDNGNIEIYDIKELNKDEFIINFDIGMEVRGIAKLIFKRES
jgi:hypothetical protein